MKKQFLLALLMINLLSYSQSNTSQVLSAGGSSEHQWTIGEPIVMTLISNNNMLTQGFNQGNLKVSTNVLQLNNDISIDVYPNPVINILNINVNNEENWNVKVIDLNGRIVFEKQNVKTQIQVDFSSFPTSTFILLINSGSNHASYNVIKR